MLINLHIGLRVELLSLLIKNKKIIRDINLTPNLIASFVVLCGCHILLWNLNTV